MTHRDGKVATALRLPPRLRADVAAAVSVEKDTAPPDALPQPTLNNILTRWIEEGLARDTTARDTAVPAWDARSPRECGVCGRTGHNAFLWSSAGYWRCSSRRACLRRIQKREQVT